MAFALETSSVTLRRLFLPSIHDAFQAATAMLFPLPREGGTSDRLHVHATRTGTRCHPVSLGITLYGGGCEPSRNCRIGVKDEYFE